MKPTNVWNKLLPSILNVVLVFAISLPVLYFFSFFIWKVSFILLFFVIHLVFLIFNKGRGFGMVICKTYWEKDLNFSNGLLYLIFYTLSFTTILFYIWFPFDLLLINLLLVQLPMILNTGRTLHGYIAGSAVTVKKN